MCKTTSSEVGHPGTEKRLLLNNRYVENSNKVKAEAKQYIRYVSGCLA